MKFICLQENLEKALALINRTVTAKTQLPVASNILLKTTKKGIEITGTDLENTTRTFVLGKTEKEGGILIPTRTLTEIINALPKERVTVEVDELIATITSGKYKVKIHGISPEEFPEPPPLENKEKISIDTILPYSKMVAFAAAADESRAVLTGVLVIFDGKTTTLVATDGYRLSLKKLGAEVSFDYKKPISFIIPARVFTEIAKVVAEKRRDDESGGENYLALKDEKNQIVFLLDGVSIFTRLLEGEFPTYEKIIPQTFDTRVVFDKEEFTKAVKLSSIFARESANIVKLKVTKKGLFLSANAPQVGENLCEVEGTLEGEENEIAFNSRFLLDFLANVDTKEIAFETTGPLNPGVFKIPGDDSYLHIIMPVRVQG